MSVFSSPPQQAVADSNLLANDFALVDSHCHLDFFLDNRDNGKRDSYRGGSQLPLLTEVLARACGANISTLLTIATDFSRQSTLLSLCEDYDPHTDPHTDPQTDTQADPHQASTKADTKVGDPETYSSKPHMTSHSRDAHSTSSPRLFCSAGTHPTSISEDIAAPSTEQLITAHRDNPSRVIAFGESGLDFFRSSNPPASLQYASFRNHILASQETQIPLVIHNRNADLELERILIETQSNKAYPCILHCFAGSERLARVALELGCMLSFAGLVTYPSARELLTGIIENTPISRLLIETDSPFLPPQDNSQLGKKRRASYCEPAMLRVTAEHIASLKGLSLRELATATRANFASLFDL